MSQALWLFYCGSVHQGSFVGLLVKGQVGGGIGRPRIGLIGEILFRRAGQFGQEIFGDAHFPQGAGQTQGRNQIAEESGQVGFFRKLEDLADGLIFFADKIVVEAQDGRQ